MNDYDEGTGCRFDCYCKRLLRNELVSSHREYKKQNNEEVPFSSLTPREFQRLQYIDEYHPERTVFPALRWTIEVRDGDLARALSSLPVDRRNIILLFYLFGLTDQEIGTLMKLSRSTVQYRRAAALDDLRKILEG